MASKKPTPSYFYDRLREHLGLRPEHQAVFSQTIDVYQRPNLHLAIDELLGKKGTTYELEGVVLPQEYETLSLSKISRPRTARTFESGPVEYEDVELARGKSLACIKRGIYWIRTRQGPVVMLTQPKLHAYPPRLGVELMAADRDVAQDFLRQLAASTHRAAAFRGNILSLELGCSRELTVRFHSLPKISADDIILPETVRRRLERQTLGFVTHAEQLRRAGRHMKRGILLHGPPGTGKTLSAMYIASQMPGRTVLILTGGGISAIESSGVLARSVEPATIILEDVDLIGTIREDQSVGANALLFELLNQMDGLAEDADVLFILTTNRPDILEPALASRPGRIDQAIEIPLPDAECRRRLFHLYSRGVKIELQDLEELIRKTDGVSAAFIRELLRKATLFAAEESPDLVVRDAHLLTALDELLLAGGPLTARLLGSAQLG